eukprot:13657703-Alexandrium_andersonii.AAC.1
MQKGEAEFDYSKDEENEAGQDGYKDKSGKDEDAGENGQGAKHSELEVEAGCSSYDSSSSAHPVEIGA